MPSDVIRVSMNLVQLLLIVGLSFAVDFFAGLWVAR
ncbi:hypothetical protein EV647_2236 [Kribbella sp. VKM Ac-2566]|nr:hypothetical protein EV647_2236 [Kribbella sp. VKM Ac-2566]